MNKTQLAAAVAEKAGVSKADAATYVNMVLGAIADNICEGAALLMVTEPSEMLPGTIGSMLFVSEPKSSCAEGK